MLKMRRTLFEKHCYSSSCNCLVFPCAGKWQNDLLCKANFILLLHSAKFHNNDELQFINTSTKQPSLAIRIINCFSSYYYLYTRHFEQQLHNSNITTQLQFPTQLLIPFFLRKIHEKLCSLERNNWMTSVMMIFFAAF